MYVSLTEAKTLLNRVLAVYKDSGVVDDDHLTLILESSEGMVNAALGSRYTIPVTDSVAIDYIRGLVIPIMRYKTWVQFAEQEDFPDGVMEEYKSTMKELDKLAKQVTSLPNESEKTTGRPSHITYSDATSPIEGF